MSAVLSSDMLEIIQSEYEEMPELRLTLAQASRLWSLETFVAKALLDGLVRNGFLTLTADGRYGRLSASWSASQRDRGGEHASGRRCQHSCRAVAGAERASTGRADDRVSVAP